jgi:hypothetical protein
MIILKYEWSTSISLVLYIVPVFFVFRLNTMLSDQHEYGKHAKTLLSVNMKCVYVDWN